MKILNLNRAIRISKILKRKNKNIVLVGGVFDILHLGHIRFLEHAKREGDFLFVLLESDESVRKSKGQKRPINSQKDRAQVLAALQAVDFVIILKGLLKNKDYDKIVKLINPTVLATTAKDPNIVHKVRQAKLTGAKVKVVLRRLKNKSTSKLFKKYE